MMTKLEQTYLERVPSLLNDIAKASETIAKALAAQQPEPKPVVNPAALPQFVWVFTGEMACDGIVDDVVVRAFASENAAQEFMQVFINEKGDEESLNKSIAEDVEDKDWVVTENHPNLYRAFEEDDYPNNHIELTINKCSIEKRF